MNFINFSSLIFCSKNVLIPPIHIQLSSIKLNILWLALLYHLLAYVSYHIPNSKLSYAYLPSTSCVSYSGTTFALHFFYCQTNNLKVIKSKGFCNYTLLCTVAAFFLELFV